MPSIHKLIIPLIPGPNTEKGASKVQEIKSVQDFPWSHTCTPIALHYVVRACQSLLQSLHQFKNRRRLMKWPKTQLLQLRTRYFSRCFEKFHFHSIDFICFSIVKIIPVQF